MASSPRSLISGGGIAGLTLGDSAERHGLADRAIVEREPSVRTEGDTDGTSSARGGTSPSGWGLTDDLLRHPLPDRRTAEIRRQNEVYRPFISVPIARVLRAALLNKYVTYRRRADLELKILLDRAQARGVIVVRFGRAISEVADHGSHVDVILDDDTEDEFALVFGADGAHSQVRRPIFGESEKFVAFSWGSCRRLSFRRSQRRHRSCHQAARGAGPPRRLLHPLVPPARTRRMSFVIRTSAKFPGAERMAVTKQYFRRRRLDRRAGSE